MGKICSCDAKEETVPDKISPSIMDLSKDQIHLVKRLQSWFRGYKVRKVIEEYCKNNSLNLGDVLLDAKSFDDYISQFIYKRDIPDFCSKSFVEFPQRILEWYRFVFTNLKPKSIVTEENFILSKSSQLISRFQNHLLHHISQCFELGESLNAIISNSSRSIIFKEYSDVELKISSLNCYDECSNKKKIVLLHSAESKPEEIELLKILNISESFAFTKGITEVRLWPQLKYELLRIASIKANSGEPRKLFEFVKLEDCSRVYYGQINRMNKAKHGMGLFAVVPLENDGFNDSSSHNSYNGLFYQRKKTIINLVETTPLFHPKTPKKSSRKNITSKLSITPKSNLELLMKHRLSPMKLDDESECSERDSDFENSLFLKQVKENTKIVKAGIYNNPSHLYFGLFDNDSYSGYGFYLEGQNSSYFGEFRNNKYNGYGAYKTNDLDYRGLFYNGKFHGFGELKGQNFRKYIGCFYKGKKQNIGYEVFEDKSYYVGWYKSNKASGLGYMEWKSGYRYFGFWNDGKMEGFGKYYMKNGDLYCGGFQDNIKHGQGRYIYHNTGCTLSGEWVEGLKRGPFQLVELSGQSKTIQYFENNQVG